jgi:NifU-like protein
VRATDTIVAAEAVKRLYPETVNKRFNSPRSAGDDRAANAEGRAAALLCGTYVRFQLSLDPDSKRIEASNFRTNGCGFMIAAADVLAEMIASVKLTDLHGIDIAEFRGLIEKDLGEFPLEREHCLLATIDALRAAFADFRTRQIEEFSGEKALVCTCFGVSEETIEKIIEENCTLTVAQVGELCNAGTGCGSCQFMIQEMIDVANRE